MTTFLNQNPFRLDFAATNQGYRSRKPMKAKVQITKMAAKSSRCWKHKSRVQITWLLRCQIKHKKGIQIRKSTKKTGTDHNRMLDLCPFFSRKSRKPGVQITWPKQGYRSLRRRWSVLTISSDSLISTPDLVSSKIFKNAENQMPGTDHRNAGKQRLQISHVTP